MKHSSIPVGNNILIEIQKTLPHLYLRYSKQVFSSTQSPLIPHQKSFTTSHSKNVEVRLIRLSAVLFVEISTKQTHKIAAQHLKKVFISCFFMEFTLDLTHIVKDAVTQLLTPKTKCHENKNEQSRFGKKKINVLSARTSSSTHHGAFGFRMA